MFGGRSGDGGGSSPSVLQQTSLLQVNPVDIPALEIKLGALVVLLCITLLFGFAPFWLVRGARLCCAGPGESSGPDLGYRREADPTWCRCRRATPDVQLDQLFRWRRFPGHVSAGSAAGLPAEHHCSLQRRRDHGTVRTWPCAGHTRLMLKTGLGML